VVQLRGADIRHSEFAIKFHSEWRDMLKGRAGICSLCLAIEGRGHLRSHRSQLMVHRFVSDLASTMHMHRYLCFEASNFRCHRLAPPAVFHQPHSNSSITNKIDFAAMASRHTGRLDLPERTYEIASLSYNKRPIRAGAFSSWST